MIQVSRQTMEFLIFFKFSTKTRVVVTQKDYLTEMVLLSTKNMCFRSNIS